MKPASNASPAPVVSSTGTGAVATSNWSGAALIDREGKLLGIGSLIVREATSEDPKLPGNVFVPIDLLKPILDDLVREGHRAGPARPWLGIAADEVQGRLIVTRVMNMPFRVFQV